MQRALGYLAVLVLALCVAHIGVGAQQRAEAAAAYAVAYVDVAPSGRAAAVAAFRQYREASRGEAGSGRFTLLEQTGRPGHFVILEAWADRTALDAHGARGHVQAYRDALDPLRLSGYDERPYGALDVAPPRELGGDMVHVVTHVDIGGGAAALGEAMPLLRELAAASRREPGNVRFDVLRHATRGNHFTIHETWQRDALDVHAAAAHTRAYREKVQPMTGSPLDERVYVAVD